MSRPESAVHAATTVKAVHTFICVQLRAVTATFATRHLCAADVHERGVMWTRTRMRLEHEGHEALAHDAPEVSARHQLLPHVAPLAEADGVETVQVILQRDRVAWRCATTRVSTRLLTFANFSMLL